MHIEVVQVYVLGDILVLHEELLEKLTKFSPVNRSICHVHCDDLTSGVDGSDYGNCAETLDLFVCNDLLFHCHPCRSLCLGRGKHRLVNEEHLFFICFNELDHIG